MTMSPSTKAAYPYVARRILLDSELRSSHLGSYFLEGFAREPKRQS